MHQRNADSNWVGQALLLASMVWCTYWFIHAWPYWEDDSYIHLEYARSVFEGKGFMFNGTLSNGDTSPVWVLLLVASHVFSSDWVTSGKILSVLGAVFALGMAYIYSRRLAQDIGLDADIAPAVMVTLFVVNPYFCYWAFSGMEAVAAAGLTMLIAMLVVPKRASVLTFFGAAAAIGIAPLVRPEMVLLSAIAGLFLLRQWHALTAGMPTSSRLVYFVAAALLLALPLLGWAAYALDAFGYVLPNTNAAKRAAPDVSVSWRLLQVYGVGFPGVLLALALLPFGLSQALKNESTAKIFPVVTWPVLLWFAVTSVFYIVNHTHVQTRYVVVSAPAVMFTLLLVLWRSVGARLVYPLAGATVVFAFLVSVLLVHPFVRNKGEHDQGVAQLATFISRELPVDAGVAVYSIGQLGFMVGNPIIDVGGITRPEASQLLYEPQAVMTAWAKRNGAGYYIMGDKPEPQAQLVMELPVPEVGWSMKPSFYDKKTVLRLWKLS
ncbi:MAG: hypothetical protein Q7U28_06705 [Aquabacterium sp.]|nr:hypothetical protein [Aquabacterium sp.]